MHTLKFRSESRCIHNSTRLFLSSQLQKNAALIEEERDIRRQLRTDVNRLPFPTHRADFGARENCLTIEGRSI